VKILKDPVKLRRLLGQMAIVSFCFVHFGSIIFWSLPWKDYPQTPGVTRRLPAPLDSIEHFLIQWRANSSNNGWSWLSALAYRYVDISGSAQYWAMFAHPGRRYEFLEVRTVIGWKKLEKPPGAPATAPANPKAKFNWAKNWTPIYDPMPLYSTFNGPFGAHSNQYVGARLYTRDTVFLMRLAADYPQFQDLFLSYFERSLESKYGRKPLGVHLVKYSGHIQDMSSAERVPASDDLSAEVVAFIHNGENNIQSRGSLNVQTH